MAKKKPSVRTNDQSQEEPQVRATEQSQEVQAQADEQSKEPPMLAKEPSQETQALTKEQIQAIQQDARKAGAIAGGTVSVAVNAICIGANYALSQDVAQNLSKAEALYARLTECFSRLTLVCKSVSSSNASSIPNLPISTEMPVLPLIPTTLQAFCQNLPEHTADEILGQCRDLTSLMAETSSYTDSQLCSISDAIYALQNALSEELKSTFTPLANSFLQTASQRLASCSGEDLTQASADACAQLAYGLVNELSSPQSDLRRLSNITDILRQNTLTLADVEAIGSQCQNIVSELPDLQQHCTTLIQEAAKKTAYSEVLLEYLSWLATQSHENLVVPLAKGAVATVQYGVFKPAEYLVWLLEQGTDAVKNNISSEGVKRAGETLGNAAMESPGTTAAIALATTATLGIAYHNRKRISSGASYVCDSVTSGFHTAKSAGGNTLSYMYNGLHRNTVGRFASANKEKVTSDTPRL